MPDFNLITLHYFNARVKASSFIIQNDRRMNTQKVDNAGGLLLGSLVQIIWSVQLQESVIPQTVSE